MIIVPCSPFGVIPPGQGSAASEKDADRQLKGLFASRKLLQIVIFFNSLELSCPFCNGNAK